MTVAGREPPVNGLRELPLRVRNHGPWRLARLANREHVTRILWRGYQVFGPSNVADDQVPQWNLRRGLGGHQITAQQPGDSFPMFLRDRSIELQSVAGRIPLPPEANEPEAMAPPTAVTSNSRECTLHGAIAGRTPSVGM